MSVGILQQGDRELTVLSALLTFPCRGIWSTRIEVDADEGEPLAIGPATLILAADNEGEPIELVGTIEEVDASTFEGRATAVMVAGAGKLASTFLPARTYQQAPFPVPVASICTDAIEEAGENFDDDVALAELTVDRWHRIEMTAARLLDRLAERNGFAWRMNDEGFVVFAIDEWPEADEADAGLYLEGPEDAHDRTLVGTVARASIRPGTTVRGRRIEEVYYMLDGAGLRVMFRWGTGNGAGGLRGDVEAATRRAIPQLAHYCTHEVTVRRQNQNGTLEVEADDPSIGGLTGVPYYPGIVVCSLNIAEGTRALLSFIGGDESKPAIVGFTRLVGPPDAEFGSRAIARVTAAVDIGSMTFTAVPGSGGIASISVAYTPPTGPTQNVVIAPGTPVSINLTGVIQSGSPEVFVRAET
jgi:hypothetical protein